MSLQAHKDEQQAVVQEKMFDSEKNWKLCALSGYIGP